MQLVEKKRIIPKGGVDQQYMSLTALHTWRKMI